MSAFFDRTVERDEEVLNPLERATGAWSTGTIRGPAITLLLARALEEQARTRPELRAVRATYDLHSPVPQLPLRSRSQVLRVGRRLMLIESELVIEDSVRARARGLFLHPEGKEVASGPGERPASPLPPAPDVRLGEKASDGMLFWSEEASWTTHRAPHQHAEPKAVWFAADSLVAGEELTGFQLASAAADMGNVVVNWGPEGVGEINADVSVSLARMPAAGEVGVLSLTRLTEGGVSVGSAVLFDRLGAFGTTTVSSIPTAGDPINYAPETSSSLSAG